MSEYRAGEGKITSSTDAKQGLGRGAFVRPAKDHIGVRSNPTEWTVEKRLATGKTTSPTALEKETVFEANRAEVKTLKLAGLSDEEIYEALKDR